MSEHTTVTRIDILRMSNRQLEDLATDPAAPGWAKLEAKKRLRIYWDRVRPPVHSPQSSPHQSDYFSPPAGDNWWCGGA